MTLAFDALLARLLSRAPGALSDEELDRDPGRAIARTIDRAIWGGARADRVGFAFAAGYRAALERLIPDLPDGARVSLCATEAGGVQPSAMQTALSEAGDGDLSLSGHKRYATLATSATHLLVVAVEGAARDGRRSLRLVRIPADRAGVTITELPPLPFAPEIGHAEVRLAGVAVAAGEVLPGDGWSDYLKPFRTVEDLHVHAALVGHLLAIASRARFPADLRERLVAILLALRAADELPASAPPLHVALAGLIALTARAVDECRPHLALAGEEVRARFERDAPLLRVAATAREKRRLRAWERLE